MGKYWLTLFPDVFLWKTRDDILIYNSKNKKFCHILNHPVIEKYIGALHDLDNLFTVEVTEREINNPVVKTWIEKIIAIGAGQLLTQSENILRPVSFFPLLNLQNDINHIRWMHKIGINGSIINTLQEIIIHLTGSTSGNLLFAKQTIYPLPSFASIPIKDLINFLQSCKGGWLQKINLVGNVIGYAQLEEFGAWLDEHIPEWTVVQLASDIITNKELIDKLRIVKQLTVICDDLSLLDKVTSTLKLYPDLNHTYIFPLTSEEMHEQIITETEKYKITDCSIVPLFNGENIAFFEKYVYTTGDDFQEIQLSKREVFAHQALNTNFFGKLIVLPDGKVYANLNHEALGTINEPIYDLLYREMDTGDSWRMIRDSKPCSDCVYQWLCPSPSNYELIIGKNNLCHIKNGMNE